MVMNAMRCDSCGLIGAEPFLGWIEVTSAALMDFRSMADPDTPLVMCSVACLNFLTKQSWPNQHPPESGPTSLGFTKEK